MREILNNPRHLLSDHHKSYVEEFKVKRTSHEMRELMELTHAAKRDLMSMKELGYEVWSRN